MKDKVIKTTYEKEQRRKEEAFLKLTPIERLAWLYGVQHLMRKPGFNYSYEGLEVKVKKGK